MDHRCTLSAAATAAQEIAERALDVLNAPTQNPGHPAAAAPSHGSARTVADTARARLAAVLADAERRAACLQSVATVLREGTGEVEHAELAGPLVQDVQAIALARRAGLLPVAEAVGLADYIEERLADAQPAQVALDATVRKLRGVVRLAHRSADVRELVAATAEARLPTARREALVEQLAKAEAALATCRAAYRARYGKGRAA